MAILSNNKEKKESIISFGSIPCLAETPYAKHFLKSTRHHIHKTNSARFSTDTSLK